ncbi:hypothetical protein O3P69_002649 [Scylla paramamosain]|uniref:Secreted protein n=1 Tax=Scylla paramamosain TaxID=85552 RepID=A0AAW0UQV4_SCYPA
MNHLLLLLHHHQLVHAQTNLLLGFLCLRENFQLLQMIQHCQIQRPLWTQQHQQKRVGWLQHHCWWKAVVLPEALTLLEKQKQSAFITAGYGSPANAVGDNICSTTNSTAVYVVSSGGPPPAWI